MSRADMNLRAKAKPPLPQKPGRTAARLQDQRRKAATPKVRRVVARLRLDARVRKAAEAGAK